jgi:serine/threonine protein phosphatase PrpC
MDDKKKQTRQKRFSTFNFSNMSKKLDKITDSEKGSKRKLSKGVGECATYLVDNNLIKPTLSPNELLTKKYDYYESPKFSTKQIGPLKSYSYNTYQGLYKDNNEDRVSVCSLVKKPASSKMKVWPKISYFAVFDGHGGEECSEFLEKNFLNYLVENANFPFDIKLSMIEACQKIEEGFFKEFCKDKIENSNFSGSCALIAVVFDNKIYIGNIGDSRAIMSICEGTKVKQLTMDHKPDNVKEFERALKNGSKIYLDDNDDVDIDESKIHFIKDKIELEKMKAVKENSTEEKIFRVYPSDLAVMRTIGDIKAKKKEYGGIPGTIINIPEIFIYDINSNDDFIVLGCDGIFDDLSNEEVINAAWMAYKHRAKEKNYDIHESTKDACDLVIRVALEKQTTDNLSCIIIGLEGLEKYFQTIQLKEKVNSNINNFKREIKYSSSIK